MTVLEAMVAMALFAIVSLAVAESVAAGARVVSRAAARDASSTILTSELEKVRGLTWAQTAALPTSATRTIDNVTYTITTAVSDVCPNATAAPACPATSTQTATPANPFSPTGIALSSPSALMHRSVAITVTRTGGTGAAPAPLTGTTVVTPTQNTITPSLRISAVDAGTAKRVGGASLRILRNGIAQATVSADAFGVATYTLPSATDVSATWTVDSADANTPAANGPVAVVPTAADEGGAVIGLQRKATVNVTVNFPSDAGAGGWAGAEYRINPNATYLRLGAHVDYSRWCVWFFGWSCTGYSGPNVLWSDSAATPVAIPLSDIGASPGDTIRIDTAGAYCVQYSLQCGRKAMAGVFSSTNVVSANPCPNGNAGCPNPPLRVPGAVGPPTVPGGAAATAAVTPASWNDPTWGNRDAYISVWGIVPGFDSTADQPTDIPQDFQITNDAGAGVTSQVVVPAGARYLFVTAVDDQFYDNIDNGDLRVRIQKYNGTVVGSTSVQIDPRATYLANRYTTCGLSSWTAFLNCFGTIPLDIVAWINGSNRTTATATPIDLAALGASAGDQVVVVRNGRFVNNVNAWGGTESGMTGVVASQPTLSGTCNNAATGVNCSNVSRVGGLLPTGQAEYATGTSFGFMYDFGLLGRYWYDPLPTDISGDFLVATNLPADSSANKMGTSFTLPAGGRYLYVNAYEANPIWWDNGQDANQPFGVTVTIMKPAKGACVTVTLAGDGRGRIPSEGRSVDVCKYATTPDALPPNVTRVGTSDTFSFAGYEPQRPYFAGGTPASTGLTPATAETAPPRIVASVTGFGYAPVVTTVTWPATGSATVTGTAQVTLGTTATTYLTPIAGTSGARRLLGWGVGGIGRGLPLSFIPDPDITNRSYWLPAGTWSIGVWQPDDATTAASSTTAAGTTTMKVGP